ncbi:hypothetical protein ACN28E_24435 [Archangium lansingense]|uniref:hypothetical protein n=1 Tax=Archangium lansingense TaxID=2995310 RepID=UPI003B820981
MNGKPVSEFYGQFTYEKFSGATGGVAAFPAQPDGINLFVATVFLMQDKSFTLYYAEGAGMDRAVGYAAAVGKTTTFTRATNSSPNDSQWADYQ